MISYFYSIKDELTGFNAPMVLANDEVAVRSVSLAIRTQEQIRFNAKDFSLYKVGSFDSETGKVEAYDLPIKIVDVLAILPKESEVKNEVQ